MLYLIHGFLGQPKDWHEILPKITYENLIDPYSIALPTPNCGLSDWAVKFNEVATLQTHPSILLGYSMGGRLAMHALIHSPEKWAGAVIISAQTGFSDDQILQTRLKNDFNWADRFENEAWTDLMHSWNSQPVFASDKQLIRNESDYSRKILADTLRYWSVGFQQDLKANICQLPMPILWIAGEKDHTYANLAKTMTFAHPSSEVWIAPEVGHRVPWECKKLFQEKLQKFLIKIDQRF